MNGISNGQKEFSPVQNLSHKNIFNNFHLIKLYLLFDRVVIFLSISSIFIAINCLLLVYFSFLLYSISIDLNLLLSSYLLTFTVYSLDKLSSIKEDSICMKERAGFIERHKKILTYVTVASYIIAIYLSFSNSLALFAVLFPQVIGIIYSIKISDFRLKDITGVKNIVVALSWAVVGTFLPLENNRRNLIQILLIFYLFFTKLFINTVLFDVRDIEGDGANGVITIPVLLGIEKTRILLLILNSTLISWLVFSYLQGFFQKYLLIIIFAISYGYWYILHFCRKDIKIGKSLDLLVDGEWIPIAILALIFSRF